MAHSDCGWTCGCAGKSVKSLENTCHTWALLLWWFTTKRRYIKCMHPHPRTACYGEQHAVRGRIEEGGFQFHSQSNFDSNFQAYDIIIAARVHTTQPVHGSLHWTEKWHLLTSSQELRIDFTAFARRPYFCN